LSVIVSLFQPLLFAETCTHRFAPQNGMYTRSQRTKTTWFVDEEATYICNDGFVITGSRSSRCLRSGWSTIVPNCERGMLCCNYLGNTLCS